MRAKKWPGRLLGGRYELRRPLHQGPMSCVFEAFDRQKRRHVAIKLVEEGLRADDLVARLQREGMALACLRHERVVRLRDAGADADARYLVLEFVYGCSLEDLLHDVGRVPFGLAIRIAAETLEGLAAIHRAGLVHRDIKPGNLMVGERGIVIVDLGLCTLQASCGRAKRLTGPMRVVGTPQFLAPEQCVDGPPDARTDLYACGAVLFAMLTGDAPFLQSDVQALMHAHRHRTPPTLADVDDRLGAPEALEAVVRRALAKTPSERFASADEMRRALLSAAIA